MATIESAYYGDEKARRNITQSLNGKVVGTAIDINVDEKLIPAFEVVDKTEEEIAADVASKAANVRAARDRALSASDWTQVADAPVDKQAWATYRQALRDLPDAEGWPNVDLPHFPDYVAPLGGNSDGN